MSIRHFIVASVLTHAAIVPVWVSTSSHKLQLPASVSSAPTFHIALQPQTREKHIHHTIAKQRKAHKPVNQRPSELTSVTPNTQPIASTEPASPATTSTTSDYQAQLHREVLRDRVLSKIRKDFRQFFVYPVLARREGWQGQVLLGFSVEANGVIRNIHVAAGSGYSILDNSAMSALAQIHSLTEVSSWLRGQRMTLQMPVIYRLQGG